MLLSVRAELERLSAAGELEASSDYVDRMRAGLGHWVEGADRGYLSWGILHFRKTS